MFREASLIPWYCRSRSKSPVTSLFSTYAERKAETTAKSQTKAKIPKRRGALLLEEGSKGSSECGAGHYKSECESRAFPDSVLS
jgi:hypothetical protein